MRVAIIIGLDALSRGFTSVKLRSTGVAGANFASPDCVATTVQRTGSGAMELRKACAKESSRCPKTSQVFEVTDLKVTGRPEEAVAFNGTVGPNSRLGIGGKLIVCVVNSGSGCGAGKRPNAGVPGSPFFSAGAGRTVSVSPFGSRTLSRSFTTTGAGAGVNTGAGAGVGVNTGAGAGAGVTTGAGVATGAGVGTGAGVSTGAGATAGAGAAVVAGGAAAAAVAAAAGVPGVGVGVAGAGSAGRVG